MNAIICQQPEEPGIRRRAKRLFMPPLTQKQYTKNGFSVTVYTFNPCWKALFPKMISRLKNQHEELIFDDTMASYRSLSEQAFLGNRFFQRFAEILDCFSTGDFLEVAVVCDEQDHRLLSVLEALCKHVKVVTILTEDSHFFDEISAEAMRSLGLSLTLKDLRQKRCPDLTVLLSKKSSAKIDGTYVINLSDRFCDTLGNLLTDFSCESVTDFLNTFPKIRIKSCYLVPHTEPIRNLIWKISKKS